MINTHEELRAKARTINDDPTETDQSGAAETDLNIVLTRYMQSGTVQSHGKDPMYMDWTEYPENYRDFIHTTRDADALRQKLPHQLRTMPLEELLALTPEQLNSILTPPAEPTDTPQDETK